MFLAFDIAQVIVVPAALGEHLLGIGSNRLEHALAGDKLRHLAQAFGRIHLDPGHHGGLGGVVGRNDDPVLALVTRVDRDRQHAVDAADLAAQRQFPDDRVVFELRSVDLFADGEDPDRDRQIETRSFLFYIGRREVDGRVAHHPLVPAVDHRGADAVLGFFDGGIRQADHDHRRFAPAGIHLDLDRVGIDAEHRGRMHLGKHEPKFRAGRPGVEPFRGTPGVIMNAVDANRRQVVEAQLDMQKNTPQKGFRERLMPCFSSSKRVGNMVRR